MKQYLRLLGTLLMSVLVFNSLAVAQSVILAHSGCGLSLPDPMLAWRPMAGVASFRVTRQDSPDGTCGSGEVVALVPNVGYSDTQYSSRYFGHVLFHDDAAEVGRDYYYSITPILQTGADGNCSGPLLAWRGMNPPGYLHASDGVSESAVLLYWSAHAQHALRYQLTIGSYPSFRDHSVSGLSAPTVLNFDAAVTSYVDAEISPYERREYHLQLILLNGRLNCSGRNNSGFRAVRAPTLTVQSEDGHVALSWSPIPQAVGYVIRRYPFWSVASDGELWDYSFPTTLAPIPVGSATEIQRIDSTQASFSDTSAIPGLDYYYQVAAIFDAASPQLDESFSTFSRARRADVRPRLSASDGTSADHIRLSLSPTLLDPSPDYQSVHYEITRDGVQIAVVPVTSGEYLDRSTQFGRRYQYGVRAIGVARVPPAPTSQFRSDFSFDTGWRAPPSPYYVRASDGTHAGGISVAWTGMLTSGLSFSVYRSLSPLDICAPVQRIASGLTEAYFMDESADALAVHYYAVTVDGPDGSSTCSESDSGFLMPPTATPTASHTATPTASPTFTATPSVVPTVTPMPTATMAPTQTPPVEATRTATPAPTMTTTATATATTAPTSSSRPDATPSLPATPTFSPEPTSPPAITPPNAEPLPSSLSAILECVEASGADLVAHYGYYSDNSEVTYLAVGSENRFNIEPAYRGQPEVFNRGRAFDVFQTAITAPHLAWQLQNTSASAGDLVPCCPLGLNCAGCQFRGTRFAIHEIVNAGVRALNTSNRLTRLAIRAGRERRKPQTVRKARKAIKSIVLVEGNYRTAAFSFPPVMLACAERPCQTEDMRILKSKIDSGLEQMEVVSRELLEMYSKLGRSKAKPGSEGSQRQRTSLFESRLSALQEELLGAYAHARRFLADIPDEHDNCVTAD